MIQRLSVGGIEVKRGDGYRAGKNRGVIGIGSDVFVDSLLEQPVVSPAARIFAFAKLVARNFLRLPGEFYVTSPRLWDVHVKQDLIGQSFFQNQLGSRTRDPGGSVKFYASAFRA